MLKVVTAAIIAVGAAGALVTSADAATTHHVDAAALQGSWAVVHAAGAGGTQVKGDFDLTGRFHATITCLSVQGNDAILTGRVDISEDASQPVGSWVVIEAQDNGASGDQVRTSFSNNGGIQRVSRTCYAPVSGPAPIDDGYVSVT